MKKAKHPKRVRRIRLRHHAQFVHKGDQALDTIVTSGIGYASDDVHQYINERLAGKRRERPVPIRWRS